MRSVAMLRGINVGGKRKVAMTALAEVFRRIGCTDVVTFIQSGNVVFSAPAALTKKIAALAEAEIEKEFGFPVRVIVRSSAQMQAVLKGNPFLSRGGPESALHVMFLDDAPGAAAVASLDADRSPGDEFKVNGEEIYLYLPNGMARTKLNNAWFDGKLKCCSTARNWATTRKLAEMAAGQS